MRSKKGPASRPHSGSESRHTTLRTSKSGGRMTTNNKEQQATNIKSSSTTSLSISSSLMRHRARENLCCSKHYNQGQLVVGSHPPTQTSCLNSQPDSSSNQQIDTKIPHSTSGFTCSACNKQIKRDRFLLKACDKYWHEACLKCDRCHARLAELGNTLYCKSNMHLCRQDYLDLFGDSGICSVCNKLIHAYEMVMRAKNNVYHLECFGCQLCNLRFCVGEQFYLCENKIVCQYDYEEHLQLQLEKSMMTGATSCNQDKEPIREIVVGPAAASSEPLSMLLEMTDKTTVKPTPGDMMKSPGSGTTTTKCSDIRADDNIVVDQAEQDHQPSEELNYSALLLRNNLSNNNNTDQHSMMTSPRAGLHLAIDDDIQE